MPLAGAVIYYCGPAPAPPGRPIGSAGPTSSYRMDPYVPRLLEAGMLGMIGKGPRSADVAGAVQRRGGVYFAATGGAGALLAETDAPGEALGIDVQKGKIAVLYSGGAAVYNKNLTERGESAEASGAAALLLRADGETVAVFSGAARLGLV